MVAYAGEESGSGVLPSQSERSFARTSAAHLTGRSGPSSAPFGASSKPLAGRTKGHLDAQTSECPNLIRSMERRVSTAPGLIHSNFARRLIASLCSMDRQETVALRLSKSAEYFGLDFPARFADNKLAASPTKSAKLLIAPACSARPIGRRPSDKRFGIEGLFARHAHTYPAHAQFRGLVPAFAIPFRTFSGHPRARR
jgi:hypothetical protein